MIITKPRYMLFKLCTSAWCCISTLNCDNSYTVHLLQGIWRKTALISSPTDNGSFFSQIISTHLVIIIQVCYLLSYSVFHAHSRELRQPQIYTAKPNCFVNFIYNTSDPDSSQCLDSFNFVLPRQCTLNNKTDEQPEKTKELPTETNVGHIPMIWVVL